jgi:hypothetical protein
MAQIRLGWPDHCGTSSASGAVLPLAQIWPGQPDSSGTGSAWPLPSWLSRSTVPLAQRDSGPPEPVWQWPARLRQQPV